MRNINKERMYLDNKAPTPSYTDVRDWVEDVVDGFNKGMKFDGMVDKKAKEHAVSLILSSAKNRKQKPYKTYSTK